MFDFYWECQTSSIDEKINSKPLELPQALFIIVDVSYLPRGDAVAIFLSLYFIGLNSKQHRDVFSAATMVFGDRGFW